MQLQEEKVLNLNDSIAPYFPQYPRWCTATIRQLLNMSSGFASYTELPIFNKGLVTPPSQKIYSLAEILNAAYKKPDEFLPGEMHLYSNTNYLLLGHIMTLATGCSINNILTNRFFKKLNLFNTFYNESSCPENITARLVHGYFKERDCSLLNGSILRT